MKFVKTCAKRNTFLGGVSKSGTLWSRAYINSFEQKDSSISFDGTNVGMFPCSHLKFRNISRISFIITKKNKKLSELKVILAGYYQLFKCLSSKRSSLWRNSDE